MSTRADRFHVGDRITRNVAVPGLVAAGGGDLTVPVTHLVQEVGPDWVRTATYTGGDEPEVDHWGNHPHARATLRDLWDNGAVKLRPWPKRTHSAAQILISLLVHHKLPGWIHVPRPAVIRHGYPDHAVVLNLPWTVLEAQAHAIMATIREYQPYRNTTTRLSGHGTEHFQILIYPTPGKD